MQQKNKTLSGHAIDICFDRPLDSQGLVHNRYELNERKQGNTGLWFILLPAALPVVLLTYRYQPVFLVGLLLIIAGAVFLYTRMKKDDILSQKNRRAIFEYIENKPGNHFDRIRKDLELSSGTLNYHLKVLERQGYIKSVRVGFRKKFFVVKYRGEDYSKLTKSQSMILQVIEKKVECSQAEIGEDCSMTQSAISKNLKKLEKANLVQRDLKEGVRVYRLYNENDK